MSSNNENNDNNNNLNNENNNNNNNDDEQQLTKKKSFKDKIKSKFSGLTSSLSGLKSNVGNKLQKSIIMNNPITNNIGILSLGIFIFIFVVLMVFGSNTYRTKRTLHSHDSYQRYLTIKNYYSRKNVNDKILGNHYIASSFNSCNVKNSILSYMSLEVFENILKSGARYIEIKIFNDKFGSKNIKPIINNGLETGEWKLCFNTILFEDFCKVIQTHAFKFKKLLDNKKTEGVNNPDDPLFLALDLKVRNNTATLNEMSRIIVKYLSPYLLPSRFRNSKIDLFGTKMSELKKKIIIFSSDGYQGSHLEELINASWNNDNGTLKRYTANYLELLDESQKEIIRKEAKQKIIIVVPEDNLDNQIDLRMLFKKNYNSKVAFDIGCQFNCMYYQKNDEYMDDYITRFKNYSILSKPKNIISSNENENENDTSKNIKKKTYQDYTNKINEAVNILKQIED